MTVPGLLAESTLEPQDLLEKVDLKSRYTWKKIRTYMQHLQELSALKLLGLLKVYAIRAGIPGLFPFIFTFVGPSTAFSDAQLSNHVTTSALQHETQHKHAFIAHLILAWFPTYSLTFPKQIESADSPSHSSLSRTSLEAFLSTSPLPIKLTFSIFDIFHSIPTP